ncbi:MAG: YkgJ family cysteine cluster protein [Planctomycetia bacterium]|jgi:Fe-S-cluster containining protein|nr:YkgJ family cysteine cluster protein [Planctomycetia bacterium]MCC7315211.1 YkgJ family cysteine cluster protein [Planctomycetota bacterium]OQZ06686.1 MAG: hypothetical protein B6D36_03715 [Planctomycetes bacterium UTPLA1]
MAKTKRPWYADGLQFTCTQCGNCCTGAPGYVYVTPEEVGKIAEFIGSPNGELGPEHLRKVGRKLSLTEDKGSGDCCFLKHVDGKRICTIYPVRPLQCRTWPFWDINLESIDDWNEAAVGCPGMNRGKSYDLVQIEVRLNAKRWEDVPK